MVARVAIDHNPGHRGRVIGDRMGSTIETSWWLDTSALPRRLLWARLRISADGSAEVLDLDGCHHRFDIVREAIHWLLEDEYSRLDGLIEDGEVGADLAPPHAATDAELVPLMLVHC